LFSQDLLTASFGHKKSVFSSAIISIVFILGLSSSVFAADQWDKTAPLSSVSPSTISTLLQTNNEALDRFLAYGVFGCKISYSTAAQITVGTGSVVCSNNAGAVRRLRANTSSTSVTFSDLDEGAEASSTTYYVWALADTDATTFTVKISTSSSAPTGATYYKRLGSFYNDASSNITQVNISNDSDSSIETSYDSGWFAVGVSGSYAKTHNLGTTKMLINVYFSASSDGSSPMLVRNWDAENQFTTGYMIDTITTTQFTIKTPPANGGNNNVTLSVFGGNNTFASSGYYRVIALALN
jgi:hypothetical protein